MGIILVFIAASVAADNVARMLRPWCECPDFQRFVESTDSPSTYYLSTSRHVRAVKPDGSAADVCSVSPGDSPMFVDQEGTVHCARNGELLIHGDGSTEEDRIQLFECQWGSVFTVGHGVTYQYTWPGGGGAPPFTVGPPAVDTVFAISRDLRMLVHGGQPGPTMVLRIARLPVGFSEWHDDGAEVAPQVAGVGIPTIIRGANDMRLLDGAHVAFIGGLVPLVALNSSNWTAAVSHAPALATPNAGPQSKQRKDAYLFVTDLRYGFTSIAARIPGAGTARDAGRATGALTEDPSMQHLFLGYQGGLWRFDVAKLVALTS